MSATPGDLLSAAATAAVQGRACAPEQLVARSRSHQSESSSLNSALLDGSAEKPQA